MSVYKFNERHDVTREEIEDAIQKITFQLGRRIGKFGRGCHVSKHESLGIIEEEVYELTKSVHENDLDGVMAESLDIAVACIWGYISANKMKNATDKQ